MPDCSFGCFVVFLFFFFDHLQLSQVGVGVVVDKQGRAAPWSKGTAAATDKVHVPSVHEHDEYESSERVHLGPIGPPAKYM